MGSGDVKASGEAQIDSLLLTNPSQRFVPERIARRRRILQRRGDIYHVQFFPTVSPNDVNRPRGMTLPGRCDGVKN